MKKSRAQRERERAGKVPMEGKAQSQKTVLSNTVATSACDYLILNLSELKRNQIKNSLPQP